MTVQQIIDSHVHLWPSSAANNDGHAWMQPGELLTKAHVLSDYSKASSADINGVVYIETDRRHDEPTGSKNLSAWANGPLDEIRFLRSIVEGEYGDADSKMLMAVVPWAPMDQDQECVIQWLRQAEQTAGTETWKRVKGFRFLLQAIHDQEKFNTLVTSSSFIASLRLLGERGFSFDIGVDQHSGGVWQLEAMSILIPKVHEGTTESMKTAFIINHLCKPDFSLFTDSDGFQRWKKCMQRFGSMEKVFMKLSGAFSELDLPSLEQDPVKIANKMGPWTDVVIEAFGPQKIMFGSDWPVCNVKGPRGESSWPLWRDVVKATLDQRQLSQEQKDRVWFGTATEAYRL